MCDMDWTILVIIGISAVCGAVVSAAFIICKGWSNDWD
jgi:Na+-transporting NADH:ubiquinone oxidoreductase subunit NqrC